ncbi:ABC transporter permease [Nibricoccus sp. IMCC34717]|uniref:ABC transporter permease n=1 Tax=Nibricoccus sp. IMCC34717 TaxID=3034021 RepID=UPI00384EBEEF
MPWYVYLALKQLFPSGTRFSFFTAISVFGVAVGVWLLVAITGVMGGFGEKYRKMIVDTQGDAQVRAYTLIQRVGDLRTKLLAVPGVKAATPFAQGIVMLEYLNRPSFPAIQGIDINSVEDVVPLRSYVNFGNLDRLDDDTVILSAGLAREIGVGVGGKVQVYSPLSLERLKTDEVMLPTELEVVGIFEIGHQQLDSSLALVTLRRMQDLYGLGRGVHGFNLKLKPGADTIGTVREINRALRDESAVAKTWMEANEAFLFALRMEKMLVMLITAFIVLVASFLVTSLLLISVVRKTREIGLLGALGGRPWQAAACFCLQGLVVGVLGTALGLAAGFLTLRNIDTVFRFIGRVSGNWENLVAIYQFSEVPAFITAGEVASIAAFAITMATAAGLIAAYRAAKLKVVEALRSE